MVFVLVPSISFSSVVGVHAFSFHISKVRPLTGKVSVVSLSLLRPLLVCSERRNFACPCEGFSRFFRSDQGDGGCAAVTRGWGRAGWSEWKGGPVLVVALVVVRPRRSVATKASTPLSAASRARRPRSSYPGVVGEPGGKNLKESDNDEPCPFEAQEQDPTWVRKAPYLGSALGRR